VSDLRRWAEEGATAEEIALIEASRRERAPSHARLGTLEALALAAAVTTTAAAAASTTAAATTSAATTGATTAVATGTTTAVATGGTAVATTGATAAATAGGLSVLTKVVAISLLSGAVGGGIIVGTSHPRVAPPAHAIVAPSGAAPTLVESPNAVLAAPRASSVVAPLSSGAPARSALPASTDDRLSREVSALELAHRALNDHNPESALHLLDRYRARFPEGVLASEETVLRVQALIATGNRARAQALADSYSVAHPDSPYSRRLEGLVHTAQ